MGKSTTLIKVAMWGVVSNLKETFVKKARSEHQQLNRNKGYFQRAALGEVPGGAKQSLRAVKVGSGEDVPGL